MSRLTIVDRDGNEPRRRAGIQQQVCAIRDAAGTLVAEHVRNDLPNGDKRLWWRCDGNKGLHSLKVRDLLLYSAPERAAAEC
jgi:hypothetical protein